MRDATSYVWRNCYGGLRVSDAFRLMEPRTSTRLALLGTLVVGWPEGLAVIVAVKGLARYPELRMASGTGTGANERFIIGTFASLGWAATCAWSLAGLL